MLTTLTFAMVTLMFIPFAAENGKKALDFVKSKF